MSEGKTNCPVCGILLNVKNFNKHMNKVHEYKEKLSSEKKILNYDMEYKSLLEELADEIMRGNRDPKLKTAYEGFRDRLSSININNNNGISKQELNTAYKVYRGITIHTKKHKKLKQAIERNISCLYCSKRMATLQSLDTHVSTMHDKLWMEYSQQEEVEKRLSNINLTRCKDCGVFVKNINDHLLKCKVHQKNYEGVEENNNARTLVNNIEFVDNKNKEIENFNDECSENTLVNKKAIQNEKPVETENILNYEKEIDQWDEGLFLEDSLIQTSFENNSPVLEDSIIDSELKHVTNIFLDEYNEKLDSEMIMEETNTEIISQEPTNCAEIKIPDKEAYWEENSPIKEPTTIDNVLKHQADTFQYKDDEELDPDMIIDEEQYQEEFINNLSNNKVNIVKTERVVFQKNVVDKEERDLKSDIKIFLSKMYKGYCQVCGFTFKKLNGENSFEIFNWNDKRVVKIKKSFISTADSLCLCRNCSANIKWGAFKPIFIDEVKGIENFQSKKPDEIKIALHNIVDKEVPDIFKSLLEFDDMYALEIELRKEPRNIYFTNEHLLQFIAYLQTEDEIEEEILEKKRVKEVANRASSLANSIYSTHSWLKRDETIPLELAQGFIRNATYWDHPKAGYHVRADHSHRIKNDYRHGWSVKFGGNYFLVGKAIERCKKSINEYIEEIRNANNIEINILRNNLKKHISGAVATSNNYEYDGYYPIEEGYMKFGTQAIDVTDGANFLIQELGLDMFIEKG